LRKFIDLMNLGSQLLAGTFPQRLFNELAGFPALAAGKALGLDRCFPIGRNAVYDTFRETASVSESRQLQLAVKTTTDTPSS
jgi:hypothetical protein